MIKWIGYILCMADLLIAQLHFVFILASAEIEWLVWDYSNALRIALPFIGIGILIYVLFKSPVKWTEPKWILYSQIGTVFWYSLNLAYDFIQSVRGHDSAAQNPAIEIIIFIVGTVAIHTFFYINEYYGRSGKKT